MIAQWIDDEFSSIRLGDKRLDRRLKRCVAQLSRVGESTPHCCQNMAELKATYRLVDHPKVSYLNVFSQHNQASRQRCGQNKVVYLVQDTTELDLTKPQQQIEGVGPLGTGNRKGFFFHPLYAISGQGVALGIVDQLLWARDPNPPLRTAKEAKAQRAQICFEEKESSRWLEMFQSGEQIARCHTETTFIQVADSDADVYELFCDTSQRAVNCHLIVRACHDRRVIGAVDSQTNQPLNATTLPESLLAAKERFQTSVSIVGRDAPTLPANQRRARNQARESRQCELTVRALHVVLEGKQRTGIGKLPDVEVRVVEAKEISPPSGEPPVHWVLITTLPIDSDSEVQAVLDGYRMRWPVEPYFMTLKSGMRVESMRYETLPRYWVAFAMLCVVGWRVEYLKTAARAEPEASCEKYFPKSHWVAIASYVNRDEVDPESPPTMTNFLVQVAQLGGYLNRKSQGPPGSRTLWRGMSQFETIVQAYEIFSK